MTRASVRTRSRAIADDTSPAFRSARRLPPIPLAIVLTVLTVVSVVSSVAFGAEHIPVGDVWRTVWAAVVGGEAERAHSIIILDLRLPRSVLAALVGAGLALAGAAMQTLVRNPLAEPYLLGVSAGAAVGATAVITLGFLGGLGVWALSGGALLGALGATVLVYAVASATGGLTALRLILAGVVLSSAFTAVSSFLVFMATDSRSAETVMHWMLGSVAGATWSKVPLAAGVVAVALVTGLLLHSWLDAYATGSDTAASLGVPIRALRIGLFLFQGLLVGVLVAVAGGVGFVGLIIPHAARLVVGATHRAMLPVAAAAGALFLVWVDVASRVVAAPQEMPLGIVTGIIGAPIFLLLMGRRAYTFGNAS